MIFTKRKRKEIVSEALKEYFERDGRVLIRELVGEIVEEKIDGIQESIEAIQDSVTKSQSDKDREILDLAIMLKDLVKSEVESGLRKLVNGEVR